MLNTPLGNVKVIVNGEEEKLEIHSLLKSKANFTVDSRYQVSLEWIEKGNVIDCILNIENDSYIASGIESGEELALISFYKGNTKLSIGVIGDKKGIKYEYLQNGIRMTVFESQSSSFMPMNIAWLSMSDSELKDIYCWLAADPNID